MNERIKLLADEAGMVKILTQHAHEYGAGTFEDTEYPELEKFAQLIVAECVEQILTGVRTNPPQPQPPELVQTLVRRIQQHFGFEE